MLASVVMVGVDGRGDEPVGGTGCIALLRSGRSATVSGSGSIRDDRSGPSRSLVIASCSWGKACACAWISFSCCCSIRRCSSNMRAPRSSITSGGTPDS